MTLSGTDNWLAGHGIDPDVWKERGSWRYEADDFGRVRDAVAPFLKPRSRGWLRRVVQESGGGLVMPKTAVPGGRTVPPQLRPDRAVITDPTPKPYHFHGDLDDPGLPLVGLHGGWPLTPVRDDGGGRPLLPKYVWDRDDLYVRRHLKKPHDDVEGDPEGVHRHPPDAAKYLFLPRTEQARIDLHSRAARMIEKAERVFFVLEGALKNDAVLSAGNAGEAVFSVPSVTLWRTRRDSARGWSAEELQTFARRHLQDKTVFVIPDADWIHNEMVDWNALLVRTYLREVLGEGRVYIAAPPEEFFKDTGEKGVDDWLGTVGRTWSKANAVTPGIDGLVIRGKEPGSGVLRSWSSWDFRSSWFGDGPEGLDFKRDYHALTMLSLLGPTHARSLNGLASIMDVTARGHSERVVGFLERLADKGAIDIKGSLAWQAYEYAYTDPTTGTTKKMARKDWADRRARPMIETRNGFEAYETPRTLLGDFWQRENAARIRELEAENRENTRRLREIEERLGREDRDYRNGRRLRSV